jgi:thiol-disulfide isomerase/thioredoxin
MTPRALRLAGAAMLALACGWAGIRFYTSRTMPLAVTHDGIAVPVGEASLPTASDLTSDTEDLLPPAAKIPDRLPDFSLQGLDGKPVSINSWPGKSLVINFWATWCAPCRREIPLLKTLATEWEPRNITVVGIAVDHRPDVLKFAAELKIPYPVLIGEEDALAAAATFGVESPVFPFTVFTDGHADVVALFVGELHKAQADLILGVVQRLDRQEIALPEARSAIGAGLKGLAAGNP